MGTKDRLEEMGKWLKEQGPVLGLFFYTEGMSTCQVAWVLRELEVNVSHVAVGEWVHRYSQRVDPKALWLPGLPRTLIVNDTALGLAKAEGMAPLFWLLNLLRGGIVYAEFYTGRSQWDVERLLRKIHQLYGGWLRRLVTDWGPWYRTVLTENMCGWHEGFLNLVEGLFTQPKRRLASFAGYFPRGNREDEGMDLDFL